MAYYLLNVNYRFQLIICYGCYEIIQKVMSFNDFSIVNVNEIIIKFIFGISVKINP